MPFDPIDIQINGSTNDFAFEEVALKNDSRQNYGILRVKEFYSISM